MEIKQTKWVEWEINFLNKNYSIIEMDEISQKLKRSKDAIGVKARELGLSKNYTSADIAYLESAYGQVPVNEIAERINKNVRSIRSKAHYLGLTKKIANPNIQNGETRACARCGDTYPLTDEFFHRDSNAKYGFDKRCKECKNLLIKLSKQMKKARLEKEKEEKEKQEFKQKIANEKFACKKCNQEKTGDLMKVQLKQRKVTTICLECSNNNNKKWREEQWKNLGIYGDHRGKK